MASLLSPLVAVSYARATAEALGCHTCKTVWDYLVAIAVSFTLALALGLLFFWWPNRRRNRARSFRRRRERDADPPSREP
jgi:uncharacterized BrkB/YihY/UPF0761 family membrane protein